MSNLRLFILFLLLCSFFIPLHGDGKSERTALLQLYRQVRAEMQPSALSAQQISALDDLDRVIGDPSDRDAQGLLGALANPLLPPLDWRAAVGEKVAPVWLDLVVAPRAYPEALLQTFALEGLRTGKSDAGVLAKPTLTNISDGGAVVITPGANVQSFSSAYYESIIIQGSPQLIPQNLRTGTNILGILGTATGEEVEDATVTPAGLLAGNHSFGCWRQPDYGLYDRLGKFHTHSIYHSRNGFRRTLHFTHGTGQRQLIAPEPESWGSLSTALAPMAT